MNLCSLKFNSSDSPEDDVKRLFLTTGAPQAAPYDVLTYAPLQRTGLFRNFAELALDRESIKAFANKYGLLTDGEPILIGNQQGRGETLDFWRNSIREMSEVFDLWLAITSGDSAKLNKVIKWTDDLVAYTSGSRRTGSRWMNIAGAIHHPALFDTFKKGDVFQPAWYVIQALTNAHVRQGISPKLLWNPSRTRLSLYQVPENLLSALWLQFARAVDGNRTYARCEECRNYFEVSSPDGGRRDKQFCESACRARNWRKMKAVGKTK
jgi:hypothetical protein